MVSTTFARLPPPEPIGVLEACQGTTVSSLDQLPLEILYIICYYLDIPEVLRLRRLSRYMNQVSRCRDIWCDAYRKAEFIRPPGPFLSQSARDLENALVPSFRVARNLRHTQAERPTRKLKEIQFKGRDLSVTLVFGRFLLVAFSEEVCYYDLNRGDPDPNMIYRTTCGTLKSCHCVSAFGMGGRPFACVVLNEMNDTTGKMCISIYSVNARNQPGVTLELLHQIEHSTFEVNAVDLGPRVIVIQGRLPMGHDFDANRDLIIVDVHACTRFLLSPLSYMAPETKETSGFALVERIVMPTSISTSTHLLLAKSFYSSAAGWITFFQAFLLSPSETHYSALGSSSTHLTLSHSGIIPSIYVSDTVLLHDSVVDLTTQDVLVAIRVHAFEPSRPNNSIFKHGVLRLSSSSDKRVGAITFQLLGSLGQHRVTFFHPSFNGAGRVFHTQQAVDASMTVSVLEYDLRAGEQASKVAEYPDVLRFPTRRTLWDYDPYSGLLCVRSNRADVNVIEVLDLAV